MMIPEAPKYEIKLPYFPDEYLNAHIKEHPAGAKFYIVGPRSHKRCKVAAEQLGKYFRREFDYDFPPYDATESLGKDRILIFGYYDLNRRLIHSFFCYGAVGIRWREWSDAPPCWCVTFAWFHPYERRKGHLTEAWPFILKMFPNPWVEHPLSTAMRTFLKKIGYAHPKFKG